MSTIGCILTAAALCTQLTASWYGPGFVGNTTASGTIFNAEEQTAAHKTWPFGTKVLLHNPAEARSTIVIIDDRGPYVPNRQLDVSQAAAERLGMIEQGVATLTVEVICYGDDPGCTLERQPIQNPLAGYYIKR